MCNFCSVIAGDAYRMNGMTGEGAPVIVSYKYPAARDLGFDERAADATLKAGVETATAHIEALTGVRFVEVGADDHAMIEIIYNDDGSGISYGMYPYVVEGLASTSGTLAMTTFFISFAVGGFGYEYLLHEFGHMLGLKHPFVGENQLPDHLDHTDNTVMSYTTITGPQTALQEYDIGALRRLYGTADGLEGVRLRYDDAADQLRVVGTRGNDTLIGINERNAISGHAGNDEVHGRDSGDALHGNAGADKLHGHGGRDVLRGHQHADTLDGGEGDDRLFGGSGADQLFGAAGKDRLRGGTGADFMRGGAGDDVLFGDDGADTLVGGRGADFLTGQGGRDTFVLDAGFARDRVRDLNRSEGDRIDVRPLGLTAQEAAAKLVDTGQHARFIHEGEFAIIFHLDETEFSPTLFIA